MLYDTLLVCDMTYFCIKLWLFGILIFSDHAKILVECWRTLRFGIIQKGQEALCFSLWHVIR